MKVRNLILGEPLPDALKTGFESCQCDPRWIWVVEHDGKLTGLLAVAPAHVFVILLRIVMTEDAGTTDARALLAESVAEIKRRGYRAYLTWVNPENRAEAQLMSIVERSGGMAMSEKQVLCWGKV